jgi:hypothetical protein
MNDERCKKFFYALRFTFSVSAQLKNETL